jgi:hypothetical protein
VEEAGELELGDELLERKLQEYGGYEECVDVLGRMPWLSLYRVWGQSMYKEVGSPDRGVVRMREGPS